jgi:gentisate 1,2-dioxygenase
MEKSEIHSRREEFHKKLRSKELLEGYSYDDGKDFVTRPYWPYEPKNRMKPHLWRWEEVRPLIIQCGEMIGLGHGSAKYDRRVLALSNPGANGEFTMSGTLFGDLQLIRPGESAPSHRHTPCATRFILEGSGGWTTVAGERVHVKPGDIVHTGQFPWHDHSNEGNDDFIFLDVLDIPLLFFTGTSCWEFDYETITGSQDKVSQPPLPSHLQNEVYTDSQLKLAFKSQWKRNPNDFAHLSWEEVKGSLLSLAEERGSSYDGIRLELQSRDRSRALGQTVAVHTQWLRPDEHTLSHRHTGAFIYVCAEGEGKVCIEEKVFEFGPKDIFVIPSWHWHSFESDRGCFLHSISDLPLIQKMNLFREQRKTNEGKILDSGWTNLLDPFER